jgi:hypothetical protein
MEEIASDEVFEEAYRWLCDRRKDSSANNDVWALRWRWEDIKTQVQSDLLSGTYRFEPVERIADSEEAIELWSSKDALVLKSVAIDLAANTFGFRSDVKSYYATFGNLQAHSECSECSECGGVVAALSIG